MDLKDKEIKELFGIQLGGILEYNSTLIKQSMLSYQKNNIESDVFNCCTLNVNPLNDKIFQISASLIFKRDDQLSLLDNFNTIKDNLLNRYDNSIITILSDEVSVKFGDKDILLKREDNSIIVTCTDHILLNNCYSLFIY